MRAVEGRQLSHQPGTQGQQAFQFQLLRVVAQGPRKTKMVSAVAMTR